MAVGAVSNPFNHSWHTSETLRQPKLYERGDLNFCLPSTLTRNVTDRKSGSYLCLDKILTHKRLKENTYDTRAQELCENRGGRPGLPSIKAYGFCGRKVTLQPIYDPKLSIFRGNPLFQAAKQQLNNSLAVQNEM